MCGISGLIGWMDTYNEGLSTIKKMSASLHHRGPDDNRLAQHTHLVVPGALCARALADVVVARRVMLLMIATGMAGCTVEDTAAAHNTVDSPRPRLQAGSGCAWE